jgi:predicted transcriptional regulator
MPIKPKFAYRIFTGVKKYDLRKTWESTPIVKRGDRVILYVSGRVKAFMGEYIVGDVLVGSPEYIIRLLSRNPASGVSEEDFEYIRGSPLALAMEITNPLVYVKPIELKCVLRILPDFNPPLKLQKLDEYEPILVMLFDKVRLSSI